MLVAVRVVTPARGTGAGKATEVATPRKRVAMMLVIMSAIVRGRRAHETVGLLGWPGNS